VYCSEPFFFISFFQRDFSTQPLFFFCFEKNDVLSWLLDPSVNPGGEFRTVNDLAARILNLNMASIHTTSITLTNALFYLSIQPPSIISSLREEVETVLSASGGWNKVAIGQMRRVDSFLKESARMVGFGLTGVDRKTMKEFRFSNGVKVPEGVQMVVPLWCLHHDEVG
jgi:cytochrome P450